MKNLKASVVTLMLIVSITGMAASFRWFKKDKNKDTTTTTTSKPVEAVGMANPASVYCEKQGGKSFNVKSSKGDFGVCRLKDGTYVEEWDYYRQNNTPQSLEKEIIGSPNPASKFCVDKGGKSATVKDSKGNDRGICKFSNGTQIDEWDYYRQNNQ